MLSPPRILQSLAPLALGCTMCVAGCGRVSTASRDLVHSSGETLPAVAPNAEVDGLCILMGIEEFTEEEHVTKEVAESNNQVRTASSGLPIAIPNAAHSNDPETVGSVEKVATPEIPSAKFAVAQAAAEDTGRENADGQELRFADGVAAADETPPPHDMGSHIMTKPRVAEAPRPIATPDTTLDGAWQSPLPWAGDGEWNERQMAEFSEADALTQQAFLLFRKGAPYAGQARLRQSLSVIARALDLPQGSTFHQRALANGFRALEEADDFSPDNLYRAAEVKVGFLVSSHRTPILKHAELDSMTPAVARDRYLQYAREQLSAAVGKVPVGSVALHGLAKMQPVLAGDGQSLRSDDKSLALYQAALMVDERNFMASRDLGALYAAHGCHEVAADLFQRSLAACPSAETCQELARTQARLGQVALARRTQLKAASLSSEGPPRRVPVVWTSPDEFGRSLDMANYDPLNTAQRQPLGTGQPVK